MEERRGLKLERLSALAPSKSFEFPQNPQRWGNKNPLNFSNLQKLGMQNSQISQWILKIDYKGQKYFFHAYQSNFCIMEILFYFDSIFAAARYRKQI